jgi:predicted ArsR family transcriptional regulator
MNEQQGIEDTDFENTVKGLELMSGEPELLETFTTAYECVLAELREQPPGPEREEKAAKLMQVVTKQTLYVAELLRGGDEPGEARVKH